ncbi:hypothetical protein BpHYR1_015726 [Brachionus plicatilis]|uniref:Uncharacterized protein n=1 Tax=Brachionus plicatilis TaxID=10195 RepID=A0A3M7RP44_BRAPC|nr:hypothetical protein BpHYR1_015726 [Brachionus plicatilis]
MKKIIDPNELNRCFISYLWVNDVSDKNFKILAHGNSTKTAKPFIRSTKTKNCCRITEYLKSLNFFKENVIMICCNDQQLLELVRFRSGDKYYSGVNFDTTT